MKTDSICDQTNQQKKGIRLLDSGLVSVGAMGAKKRSLLKQCFNVLYM